MTCSGTQWNAMTHEDKRTTASDAVNRRLRVAFANERSRREAASARMNAKAAFGSATRGTPEQPGRSGKQRDEEPV